MSYENEDLTEHRAKHDAPHPNCEYCAWDVDAPESRVKLIPVPKGFVAAPIPPWER